MVITQDLIGWRFCDHIYIHYITELYTHSYLKGVYALATRTCQTRFLVRSDNSNGFSRVSLEENSKQKVRPQRTPTRDPPRKTNHIGFRVWVEQFSTNQQEERSIRFGKTEYHALSGCQSSLLLCTYMHAGLRMFANKGGVTCRKVH